MTYCLASQLTFRRFAGALAAALAPALAPALAFALGFPLGFAGVLPAPLLMLLSLQGLDIRLNRNTRS